MFMWHFYKYILIIQLVKYIQIQTLVQVDWEPGPTEIVPNLGLAPPKASPGWIAL